MRVMVQPAAQTAGHGGDAVQVQPQCPAHIAQGRARAVARHHPGQRSPVAAIFAVDVLDHLLAAVVLEVDVDVGRLIALNADKPAKQQVHLRCLRVDLGHAQAVAHHRIGRAAPTLAQDAGLMAGPVHDVGHRQKIRLKTQLSDQRQLVLDRLPHRCRRTARPAPAQALLGQLAQPTGGRVAGGHDLVGVFIAQLGQRKGAASGDSQRGGQPLRPVQSGQAPARPQMRLGIGLQRKPGLGHRHAQPGGRQHVLQRLA